MSLTFHSCKHSVRICSENITSEIQKLFWSSEVQSRPETKKEQCYPPLATKERAALDGFRGVHLPFLRGMGQKDSYNTHMGLSAKVRRRTGQSWTRSKAKNALKGIFIMFYTLLCWLDGRTEHLFPDTELLMENTLAATEAPFPLPKSSLQTTPVLDCRLHHLGHFACSHWQ